jgi:hypothetical protein
LANVVSGAFGRDDGRGGREIMGLNAEHVDTQRRRSVTIVDFILKKGTSRERQTTMIVIGSVRRSAKQAQY